MARGGKKRRILVLILFLLFTVICGMQSQAYDVSQGELTIEIAFDKSEYNLSQTQEPITFHGWVNYSGVSVIPFTLHLEATSDIGDVYLSQYDFTFQLPDSIPFTGSIPIDPGYKSPMTPSLTISGYIDQGAIRSSIAPRSYIIPVYYWEGNFTKDEGKELQNEESYLLPIIITGYLATSIAFVAIVSKRSAKSCKKQI